MRKVIGIVGEGPTDYMVIRAEQCYSARSFDSKVKEMVGRVSFRN